MELLGILILACLLSFVSANSQGDALFALRSSLHASDNQLSDWNPNQVNPCTWPNVMCDTTSTNVISVTLSSMNFSGTLSPKIGVLKTLSSLECLNRIQILNLEDASVDSFTIGCRLCC